MKKTLSIFLVLLVTILSLFGTITNTNANTIYEDLKFDSVQSGQLVETNDGTASIAYYKFSLSSYTTLLIDYEATEDYNWSGPELFIIKENDYHNYQIGKPVNKYFTVKCKSNQYSSNVWKAWYNGTVSLQSGSYIIGIASDCRLNVASNVIPQTFDLVVTPTVNQIKNLKATTTTNSVDLKWTGTMGANGYQIEKYTSNGYVWVADTNSIGYFENGLNSGTVYKYRIRGTVFVEDEVYYGDWSYVTAVTKPAKVGIKTPATNKKHQIIAKWNKVSGASGYQVQFAKNKSCSSVVANKTTSGASYTGKNFTKGKKYYVRVRAYKTVNGTKTYGAWSGVKAIKCK